MASWTQRAGTIAPVNSSSVSGTVVGGEDAVGVGVGGIGDGVDVAVAVCVGGTGEGVSVKVAASVG